MYTTIDTNYAYASVQEGSMPKPSTEMLEIVKEGIENYRLKSGNISGLARKASVSRQTIYKYLSDPAENREPEYDTAIKILDALDIPTDMVYMKGMKNPDIAKKVFPAEEECPELLGKVLDVILRGRSSPEVKKLQADVDFILSRKQ
jgi:DNA-binding phage protein